LLFAFTSLPESGTTGFVLIDPDKKTEARTWLIANKKMILSQQMELNV
jgi:hypothetical protein